MTEKTVHLSIGQALDAGTEYAFKGEYREAIGLFTGVLVHEPDNFEALTRLGASLFAIGETEKALYRFWRALKVNRRNSIALSNYGLCLSDLGHPEEAVEWLERATALAEKSERTSAASKAMAYNNLGNTLERLKRHTLALAALDKGIAFNPLDGFPHYNRGIALVRLGRHREALDAFDRSISLNVSSDENGNRLNDHDAYYNRGMTRLTLGDFGGFEDYEHRLLTSENKKPNLGLPIEKKWQGEAPTDKPLLVVAEQGLGDAIQFFRYVPILLERGYRVILALPQALHGLVHDTWPDIALVGSGATLDNDTYAGWVPLMSLPYRLGLMTEESIPEVWRPIVGHRGEERSRPLVAVCWAGNWHHKNDAARSIPLKEFATLFDAPVDFISVQQVRPGEVELLAKLERTFDNLSVLTLDDFRHTAVVLKEVDLVITVDTSVAHLAGSLDVPTRLLLPAYSTDWRWQLKRFDTPWYPSVALFRQPKAGQWSPVLEDAKHHLKQMAQEAA